MFKFSVRFVTWTALAAGACVIWKAWLYLAPKTPPVDPLREEVVEITAKQIVRDLRTHRGDLRSVALPPLANDFTQHVTDQLRMLINTSGTFRLIDRPLSEKICKGLRLELDGVGGQPQALEFARSTGADAVLFGSVERFESFNDRAHLKLTLHFVRVETGMVVFERPYDCEFSHGGLQRPSALEGDTRNTATALESYSPDQLPEPSPFVTDQSPAGSRSGSFPENVPFRSPGLPRILLTWMLVLFLFPLVIFPFVRSVVRQRSNGSNARALAVLLALDMVAAALLFGPPNRVWIWFGLAATALAFNLWVMNFALKLES